MAWQSVALNHHAIHLFEAIVGQKNSSWSYFQIHAKVFDLIIKKVPDCDLSKRFCHGKKP
jgi:hypothetical protein